MFGMRMREMDSELRFLLLHSSSNAIVVASILLEMTANGYMFMFTHYMYNVTFLGY